jgi:hypothetical protein
MYIVYAYICMAIYVMCRLDSSISCLLYEFISRMMMLSRIAVLEGCDVTVRMSAKRIEDQAASNCKTSRLG